MTIYIYTQHWYQSTHDHANVDEWTNVSVVYRCALDLNNGINPGSKDTLPDWYDLGH